MKTPQNLEHILFLEGIHLVRTTTITSMATTSTVTPTQVYYNNFSLEIVAHAAYLYTLVSVREFVKDLHNIKGDMAQNYKTFPVVWGEYKTKQLISILVGCALLVIAVLRAFFELNAMGYYFIIAAIFLIVLLVLLWRTNTTRQMGLLLQLVRLIILLGIISLPLLRLTI